MTMDINFRSLAKMIRPIILVLLISAFGLTSCSLTNKLSSLTGGKPTKVKESGTKAPKPKKTKTPQAEAQGTQESSQGGSQIANPASQNCEKKGGKLTIQKRGDGGEYGICTFADNLQCEEWAMMNGECPEGGIKITGYITPASQYCAITGGEYTVTSDSGTDKEKGTCAFKNGKKCDAGEYYDGKCDKNQ
jgi:putative hemolysin